MKLYTTSELLNQHADLIIMTAGLCVVTVYKVMIAKAEASAFTQKIGTGATLPL